jgi:hypothetical protein
MAHFLIFQKAGAASIACTVSAGFGTAELLYGCRGFFGPVPPPLWMSSQDIALTRSIVNQSYHRCIKSSNSCKSQGCMAVWRVGDDDSAGNGG